LKPQSKQTLTFYPVIKMPSPGRNILFIDDDADTRELVAFVLKRENYEVVVAENCEQALALAASGRFDLYLMDNWLPGGSGIDLCRRLRTKDTTTPILFYSGAAYEQDKLEALASGAQGYLTKPVENDLLIAEISRLISAARQQSAPGTAATVDPVRYKNSFARQGSR
jgi:two-component system phosphate regulon response regulator PhoB